MASLPVVAVSTCMPRRSSTLDRAKMLRASSSTSSTVRPTRSSSELLSRSSMRCFSAGRSVTTRCRNSAVSSSRRSGDSTPFHHDAARHGVQLGVFLRRQFAAGEHHHRHVGEVRVGAQLLQHLESRHVGKPQIEHDAVARVLPENAQGFGAGAGGNDLDVVVAEQLCNAHLLGPIILNHQQPLAARLGVFLDTRQGGFHARRATWAW